jgi:hypothetical protein
VSNWLTRPDFIALPSFFNSKIRFHTNAAKFFLPFIRRGGAPSGSALVWQYIIIVARWRHRIFCRRR